MSSQSLQCQTDLTQVVETSLSIATGANQCKHTYAELPIQIDLFSQSHPVKFISQHHPVNLIQSTSSSPPQPVHPIQSTSSSPPHPVQRIQSSSSRQPHPVNLTQSTASSQPHPVRLIQFNSSSPYSVRPAQSCQVSPIQSTKPSHPHPVNLIRPTSFQLHLVKLIQLILPLLSCLVMLSLFFRLIPTQTVWKEERRYRMRVAEEGQLYTQHSFSHWVLIRLHISSRKDICKRIRGIFVVGRTSGFTKEKCVNCGFITKIRGKRNIAHLWIWISLDYNQMFPLEFGVTAPGGSSSIS